MKDTIESYAIQENFNILDYAVQFLENSEEIDYEPKRLEDFRLEIRGFFEYYKNFDYKNYIISPHLGLADEKGTK